MDPDNELLRRFADDGASEAFAEFVRRNIDLVYAAAVRHVGDAHRAQDVVQAVFIDAARKAGHLRRHPAVLSWLYTSTRFAALKTIRAEQRRHRREREAQTMQQLISPEPAPDWERLRPLIDDVLHELGERDREIVLLRFFRGLPFAELSGLLRVNEGAARMRLDRALDKMNGLLAKRGVRSTSSALGLALAAQPVIATPAGLATSITGIALSCALAGTGAASALGGLLLTSKLKLGIAGAIALAGIVTVVIEVRANRTLLVELRAFDQADVSQLRRENDRLRTAVASVAAPNPEFAELTQLRARLASLKARPDGVVDSELRPPRNRGRATPEAAIETFCWAINHGDLDLLGGFLAFDDDTPENREAFLTSVSAPVRARYQTAERLCAAAFFGAVHKGVVPDPAVAVQIVSVTEDRGPDQMKIKLWIRMASGKEASGGDTYVRRPDGWVSKPFSLLDQNVQRVVRERLDPATGDFLPPKAPPTRL